MWKTGFSLDDGELRLYNDPENKRFLDSISRGSVCCRTTACCVLSVHSSVLTNG